MKELFGSILPDSVNEFVSGRSGLPEKLMVVLIGLLALYAAMKIGHFVIRLLFGLLGLAILAGGIWWFFFRH